MNITRRETLAIGGAAGAFAILPAMSWAVAAEEAIAAFTGGADVAEGGITLTAPEIAENGNTVPVEASAEGAAAIIIIASGNPDGNVVTANFGEASGASRIATRCRLAGTQDVVAIAKMADGSFVKAQQEVKVTIGGCGG